MQLSDILNHVTTRGLTRLPLFMRQVFLGSQASFQEWAKFSKSTRRIQLTVRVRSHRNMFPAVSESSWRVHKVLTI